MSNETFTARDVAAYYDHSRAQYARIWNLDKSRSLHYGYWDDSTANLHEALLKINKVLSAKACITAGDVVLDAGCGIGGSAIWLARNVGCTVTGISLSARQIAEAKGLAEKEGLTDKLNFEVNDFTNTGYPARSVDVVWAIESVCHAKEKADFIREAFRVLKPGGRLIVADFFESENIDVRGRKIMDAWSTGWAIERFAGVGEFDGKLRNAGFHEVIAEDITIHIKPSARRLYLAYFPGVIGGYLYRLFHRNASGFGKKNIDTAYYQYIALKRKLWTYNIFTALKP